MSAAATRTPHEDFHGLLAALQADGARLLNRSASPVAAEAWHWLLHDQVLIVHVYDRNDRGDVLRFALFRAVPEPLDPRRICEELESAFEARVRQLFGHLFADPKNATALDFPFLPGEPSEPRPRRRARSRAFNDST